MGSKELDTSRRREVTTMAEQTGAPAKGPGLFDRGMAAYQGHRKRVQERAGSGAHATVADGAKSAFIVFVGGLCPFLVCIVLTVSAGYYFNALRPFTGDVQSVVAYGTAAIVELVNLALFFVSAKAFWSGKQWHFLAALTIGLMLTAISVIAQVLYLSNNLDAASLGKGADILAGLPLVGGLASTALIIVTRALALHVAEVACCYVIARSAVSHKKVMQAQLDEQQELVQAALGQAFISFLQERMGAAGIPLEGADRTGLAPFRLPAPGAGATNGASTGNGHKKP
jgi:hypothetical protein